ncbi:MAG: excinuclease ABC subunit UvrA [Oscillospiraceae bacterium]|jgi:excinuclease ABC subunit A|nr:excinuclease ABC subunit UvrA [Oscillospiraceae bacterium]
MNDKIIIRGARTHNLKNIDVELPRDRLVVMTGVSGSGKSSLAFDTIYAEGQRRYIESLSSYARQFLGQMEKPDVDSIDGLSPAISIDQKTTNKNPRSTVGTVTEIYDYLRLLWARVGIPHCPECGKEIKRQTIDQIVDKILTLPSGSRISILAPVIRSRKGEHKNVFDDARRSGFVRVRADGSVYDLSEDIVLDKNKKHKIEIIVDRIVVKDDIARRLTDSIETATAISGGLVICLLHGGENGKDETEMSYSLNYACEDCGVSMDELEPRLFSFNAPYGACPECTGLGSVLRVDPDIVLPNKAMSIAEGAIRASGWANINKDQIARMYFDALSRKYGFSLNTPVRDLPESIVDMILYGNKGEVLELSYETSSGRRTMKRAFEGIVTNIERRYKETASISTRWELEQYMSMHPCKTCGGKKLNKTVLGVTVGGKNIIDFTDMAITDEIEFVHGLKFSEQEEMIARGILKEILDRLGFLQAVGLPYLTLSRGASSLSGGESQRIRLATQIGSSLTGVLYILDEPSIGLHQSDNNKLLATLKRLRDLGNTLVVVEHDEETMEAADYIVDIGPAAGVHGGEVVCAGTPEEIARCETSITGDYLSGRKEISVPKLRRKQTGEFIEIRGAREHNLKNINAKFPIGLLTAVTGVSGSGKSSLVNEILYKTLAAELNRARTKPGESDGILGLELLDKVIDIDQSPIGRTPRSNPATYTGVFNEIRTLFSNLPESRARGYGSGRFSFNVKGGRCEACAGDGLLKIEMHFLPDIYVPCEVCHGKRYNRETLEVKYKGKSIADVLDMTCEEAREFFDAIPKIKSKMETMVDVGLGYVRLGQSSTTLSGGEAQRVKLATELSKRATGRTVYVLDEPTTGLHTHDVKKLIEVLQRLADAGNTIIVIEHNLDVVKCCDYVIDLGPDGGSAGGEIVFTGTPEECAGCSESKTGQYLKKKLMPSNSADEKAKTAAVRKSGKGKA